VIQQPPKAKGFNPLGYYGTKSEPISMNLEEYESIRLLDYEGLSQESAAKYMGISRPTLTRIYESARKKIALILIEAKQLRIEGGNFTFSEEWFICLNCESKFNNPGQKEILSCPLCHDINLQPISPR
jgi:predicted DNA-binding protein (UPF0251 family)